MVIEADQLSVNIMVIKVLCNISFSIIKGEKIAFVGKNGEGKTTLSKMIVGDVDFDGKLLLRTQCANWILCTKPSRLIESNKNSF